MDDDDGSTGSCRSGGAAAFLAAGTSCYSPPLPIVVDIFVSAFVGEVVAKKERQRSAPSRILGYFERPAAFRSGAPLLLLASA